MSVPDLEADENIAFTGEMPSTLNHKRRGGGLINCWLVVRRRHGTFCDTETSTL